MKSLFLILLYIVGLNLYSQTESKLKVAFSGKLNIGAHIPKLENSGTTQWFTQPSMHLGLDPALKIRWKNSIDLSIGIGGYLNHYTFSHANFAYDIAFYALHYETRLSKYIKMNQGPFDYISFGSTIGYAPISNEYVSKQETGFTAATETITKDGLYFAPHIGTYKKEDRFGYSLSLYYSFFRVNDPYIFFNLESSNSLANGSHNGSNIGISLVIDYDLKLKEKTIDDKFKLPPPSDISERESIVKNELKLKHRNIKIIIWDHGIIDKDTVSLLINRSTILSAYQLTHKKKKIKVKLPAQTNELMLYAHNEGTVKPNTAAVIIKVGLRKYHYILNSNLEESETLKIIYEQ